LKKKYFNDRVDGITVALSIQNHFQFHSVAQVLRTKRRDDCELSMHRMAGYFYGIIDLFNHAAANFRAGHLANLPNRPIRHSP
jgi:hypothetical protein